jgi:hypothetical protein
MKFNPKKHRLDNARLGLLNCFNELYAPFLDYTKERESYMSIKKGLTVVGLLAGAVMFSPIAVLAADVKTHYPGIFLGQTESAGEREFTYGLEYEYRFDRHWGFGATYERIDDAHHGDGVTVSVGSLYYHPDNHWRFGFGLGKERIGGHDPHSETLTRLSTSYDYHVGQFGIAPTVAVDFIDGKKAYVVGVALVMPF